MNEKVKSEAISRRRTFALLGLALASVPAMALAIKEADAQTGGMERRDDRRTDRQDRRTDRRSKKKKKKPDAK
jgi:hypothetical protein